MRQNGWKDWQDEAKLGRILVAFKSETKEEDKPSLGHVRQKKRKGGRPSLVERRVGDDEKFRVRENHHFGEITVS